ncbi:TP53-regulated inhibitor of apoptosis 1-like isoform X2 [Apis dorsata]|uniref:TP53-regulated inhibitor of apoptosis n=1 Tax=Apis cerana cerana TaxID=94128 RepID=A0A2A3ET81_APICC|nr:TP53-regulated inhibitor of apoptosis 1-like isoform X2 [Apis dorsata]XP_016917878.1 TP53-regulated inhibitor of apoptosis 1 [Apis cerana]PBC34416.1 TP53-regulated inhibitor of apoptosis [Apis cerana cerana]
MEACKELKAKYDRCFNDWFSEKFLRGIYDDSECAPLLKVYTKCVAQAMKDQNINLDEINIAHLGTEQEKKTEN